MDLITNTPSFQDGENYIRLIPPRTPAGYEYRLALQITDDAEAIAPLRLEAGCFVLICNLDSKREMAQWPAKGLLWLYKNQSGIEQNFGFLKDPVIVNSIFTENTASH